MSPKSNENLKKSLSLSAKDIKKIELDKKIAEIIEFRTISKLAYFGLILRKTSEGSRQRVLHVVQKK